MDAWQGDEIRAMSHGEFKRYIIKISNEIQKYTAEKNMRIDYVVPVLRGGAVPAVYVANRLNIVKFAPIQVKKIKQNGKREYAVLLNSLKDLDKNQYLNLLVVEGTCSSGETVKTALAEIKKTLPKSNVLLACVCVRSTNDFPQDIEKVFYGFQLEREHLFVYPWETVKQKVIHSDQNPENIFY